MSTAKATFIRARTGKLGSTVTVLDENRTVDAKDMSFTDTFGPWDVHIYQIKD